MFELGRDARELFESSEPQKKRQLLNFVFQNFRIMGQNLTFEPKDPFHRIIATKGLPIGPQKSRVVTSVTLRGKIADAITWPREDCSAIFLRGSPC